MVLAVMWAVTAAMLGFMLGRVSMYGWEPEEAEDTERGYGAVDRGHEAAEMGYSAAGRGRETAETGFGAAGRGRGAAGRDHGAAAEGTVKKGRRGRNHRIAEDMRKWSVGSPVSGEVAACEEGEHSTIVIRPESDKLYAPTAGKITRLFPMGNAFLFVTEFGTELYIQAGDMNDELLARHYRPRIVQNEVVAKGKLLLEFDRQGLEAEGASAEVSICVEGCAYGGNVRMTAGERVKIGEEILQVREPLCVKAAYQV